MTITDDPQVSTPKTAGPRRRPLLLAGVGAAVVVVGAVYVGGWTPLMGVRTVTVEGAGTVTADQLIATADIPVGTPMMRVDVRAATARIADLPQVSSVDVRRVWPRTVVITVTERDAVAMQKTGSGWELLDENGNPFAMAPGKPKDLPTMQRSQDEATNTAMLDVLASLSPAIRAQVGSVSATSPNAVRLTLRDGGAVVNWGSPDKSAFKSQVLEVLLGTESGWYDVSNPETPTTADSEPVPEPSPSPTATVIPSPVATPEGPAVGEPSQVSPQASPAPAVSPMGVVTP